jgi:hypothetical protein
VALRPKLNLVVIDPSSGRPRPLAWVTIYPSNTLTLATLYADDDVTTIAQPVQANELGQVAVRVNPGIYDVSMTWDGQPPTVVEDVLAWTPEAAVLTTPGDMLIQGSSGSPTRLPIGPENTLLMSHNGLPTWQILAGGAGVPWGPPGSLLQIASDNYVRPILPGTQEQTLAMMGGVPTWSSVLPAGTVIPINQPGDLMIGAPTTGVPARLPVGPLDSVLTVSDNQTLVWASPGAVGPGEGQCGLMYESATSLGLIPFMGNKIWVNGRSRTIPDGGLRIAPTGLTMHVNYYIYVAWTGSALVLEASTTGYEQTGGLWHKAGDLSRTLVGYARCLEEPVGTPVWRDSENLRCVLSLFNQDERVGGSHFYAPRSTTSSTAVELHQEIRCYFITWGFTNVTMSMTGTAYSNTSGVGFTSLLVLDDVEIAGTHTTAVTANVHLNIATVVTKTLPAEDTLHYITIRGLAQPGTTATWHGDPGGLLACRTGITISM